MLYYNTISTTYMQFIDTSKKQHFKIYGSAGILMHS